MAYADSNYYTNTFFGKTIPSEQINTFLERASDCIDELTFNRIASTGFDSLTSFQQGQIKKSVCYQAEYLYQYGEMAEVGVGSYSLNGLSVTINSGNDTRYSVKCKSVLLPTGLMYRGLLK